MTPHLPSLLLTLLTFTPPALSHSHLSHILINGVLYHGFDPRLNQPPNHPSRVGWSSAAFDDGFVAPANYAHPDIICHKAGTSPPAHAPVRPGDRVLVQWNGWPVGHVGPVLSYLAPCSGLKGSDWGCTGVDKTELRWTMLDGSLPVMELVDGRRRMGGVQGQRWATDVMIAANNSWTVAVPAGLETGAYVLRQEVVALHYAAERGGAQNYPVCVNLWVESEGHGAGGKGGLEMDAFDARGFYREDDPGLLVNVTTLTSYSVPGPTVAVGATPVQYSEQSAGIARVEGMPVVVAGGTATVAFSGNPTPTKGPG
ncbi:lytic polysaccharide monooxygenase [Parathielavia hyrcaniae]|uniref:lytic cellulose monooxygenase (C4-dehydrogenating) n=1 Tax=Parathielavia hyrcaniae TaxID=113614 RepID=A0AAN6PW09_9PEZI|nr:lytic polysaccharide monooxygenase [Parathielavia hyrcaniae]